MADTPSKPMTKLVQTLESLCVSAVAKNSFSSQTTASSTQIAILPDVLRHKILAYLCHTHKIDHSWLSLLIRNDEPIAQLHFKQCQKINDACIEMLVSRVGTSLRALNLSKCTGVTSVGFTQLTNLPNLLTLNLSASTISNDCLMELTALSNLRDLNVKGCKQITYDGVVCVLRGLDNLSNFEYNDHMLQPTKFYKTEESDSDDETDEDWADAYIHNINYGHGRHHADY
mmetsp:Transcript_8200/g.9097  ORF Transcript_8200/g.9097 Transcript_8200/m.9097 type:complete len:229 (-) Transcript_8200:75-761(-)